MSLARQDLETMKRAGDVTLLRLSTPGGKKVKLRVRLASADASVETVVLASRVETCGAVFRLPHAALPNSHGAVLDIVISPKELVLEGALWDVCIIMASSDGAKSYSMIRTSKAFRRWSKVRSLQVDAGGGCTFFPYTAAQKRLAFAYRKKEKADTWPFRFEEFLAIALAAVGKPHWNKRHIWLVFEKYCSFAQDNGYAFFRYCMEEAPEDIRKDIYFVIDRTADDYANVRPWQRQVVDFLSFKHLLYALTAEMYIGSDSNAHLYQWRPRPSLVWSRIRKHPMFFLQHGVTCLKRVDNLFGANSANPMTYFLTTSQREQRIVTENLGYDEAHAPVLGFSRWDLFHDRKDSAAPTILLMPTWRPWLEEISSDAFLESQYCKAYSALLADKQLEEALASCNATLKFFIHPKLREHLAAFESNSSRIELIAADSMPLSELIEECSLLVTDYSSVCWDVLYLGKPVIFYQFDQAEYLETIGSYLDFESELPGIVCKEENALVKALSQCAESGFAVSDESWRNAESFLDVRDRRNRERTFEFIAGICGEKPKQ